jgi:hypothetical protein
MVVAGYSVTMAARVLAGIMDGIESLSVGRLGIRPEATYAGRLETYRTGAACLTQSSRIEISVSAVW